MHVSMRSTAFKIIKAGILLLHLYTTLHTILSEYIMRLRFKCARAVINIIREGVIIKGDQSIAYREHNFKTEVQFLNLV